MLCRVAVAQTLSYSYAELLHGETMYQHGSVKLGEIFHLNIFFRKKKKKKRRFSNTEIFCEPPPALSDAISIFFLNVIHIYSYLRKYSS